MITIVTIDGIVCTYYLLSWEHTTQNGQAIDTIDIRFIKNVYNLIPGLSTASTILVTRGETLGTEETVFEGNVNLITKNYPYIIIEGHGIISNLIKTNIKYTYNGISDPTNEGVGSAIAQDLIETWGGLTATVVDTGSVNIIKRWNCKSNDVYSRLLTLAEIFDYQVYYDYSDSTVHFEPKGYSSNIIELQTEVNLIGIPKWTEDRSQLINQLTINGASQEVETQELFSGDGSATQTFVLADKPVIIKVYEIVAGNDVEKTIGLEGSTTGAYDYTIDFESQTITCTDTWTPPASASNVKIAYTTLKPVSVFLNSPTSISQYNPSETTKFFEDIITVDDAINRGKSWLKKYDTPFYQCKCALRHSIISLNVGEKVRVIDSFNNEDRELVITKIIKKYPHQYDQLELGDKEWRTEEWGKFTTERIRRLEEKNLTNTDLVVTTKQIQNNYFLKRRYTKIFAKQYEPTDIDKIFLLGHPVLGKLGTGVLGDHTGRVHKLIQIVQGNNIYEEYIFDNAMTDGSTTATVNTTTHRIIF